MAGEGWLQLPVESRAAMRNSMLAFSSTPIARRSRVPGGAGCDTASVSIRVAVPSGVVARVSR
jgi:hypothetical protein